MTDDLHTAVPTPPAADPVPLVDTRDVPAQRMVMSRAGWVAIAVLAVVSAASLALAWRAEQRGASLEQELVRRQQDGAAKVAEARLIAKQAQEVSGEAAAQSLRDAGAATYLLPAA
ncbi:MAG: hypothetical protein ABUL50_00635 [Rhizobacter sp.]